MQVITQANESYTGTLLQGKEEKVSYKLKKVVKKPKEEWIRVENTHKAIVSKADFSLVQRLLKENTRALKGEEKAHKYTGLLYCADCKERMVRRCARHGKKEEAIFICSTHNQSKKCSRHSIAQKELDRLLISILSGCLALFVDKESVYLRTERNQAYDKEELLKKALEQIKDEIEKYKCLKNQLVVDQEEGRLTTEEADLFGKIYKKQCEELERAARGQEEFLALLPAARDVARIRQEQLTQNFTITELDRTMLLSFVDRILVYKENHIEIKMKSNYCFTQYRSLPSI